MSSPFQRINRKNIYSTIQKKPKKESLRHSIKNQKQIRTIHEKTLLLFLVFNMNSITIRGPCWPHKSDKVVHFVFHKGQRSILTVPFEDALSVYPNGFIEISHSLAKSKTLLKGMSVWSRTSTTAQSNTKKSAFLV